MFLDNLYPIFDNPENIFIYPKHAESEDDGEPYGYEFCESVRM